MPTLVRRAQTTTQVLEWKMGRPNRDGLLSFATDRDTAVRRTISAIHLIKKAKTTTVARPMPIPRITATPLVAFRRKETSINPSIPPMRIASVGHLETCRSTVSVPTSSSKAPDPPPRTITRMGARTTARSRRSLMRLDSSCHIHSP